MTFIIGLAGFWSSATVDGILGLFGSVIGVIGAFLVASYQLKKEIIKEKENQKPIVRVTNSSEFISFESQNNESLMIKLVNAGDTVALNITVQISTFSERYFINDDSNLKLNTVFKKKYSVLMGGDYLEVPLITSLIDGKRNSDANVMPIYIPMLLVAWKKTNDISFFINVSYEDREGNKYSESQPVTLKWSRIRYSDDKKKLLYLNYSIQEGSAIDENIISEEEFRNAIREWKN